MVLLGCACIHLTIVWDAGGECFSDNRCHLTSSSTVCRLRQNSGKSVWEWTQASHWHKILLSTSWKTHSYEMGKWAHKMPFYVILCWCALCSRLFATVMPINEHIGCAKSALGNVTSCSQVFTRGNTCIHKFWFSSVINKYIGRLSKCSIACVQKNLSLNLHNSLMFNDGKWERRDRGHNHTILRVVDRATECTRHSGPQL